MDELFRWMYDNLQLWGETQEQHDQAILIIAKGLRNIPMVADPGDKFSGNIGRTMPIILKFQNNNRKI